MKLEHIAVPERKEMFPLPASGPGSPCPQVSSPFHLSGRRLPVVGPFCFGRAPASAPLLPAFPSCWLAGWLLLLDAFSLFLPRTPAPSPSPSSGPPSCSVLLPGLPALPLCYPSLVLPSLRSSHPSLSSFPHRAFPLRVPPVPPLIACHHLFPSPSPPPLGSHYVSHLRSPGRPCF